MRPQTLKDYVGQKHLVGENAVLFQALKGGNLPSFILWGPPGVGKTTLAKIVAQELNRPFHILSAINSGVKDVRDTIQKAKGQRFFNSPNPVLFIDEIHRFSKSQQDSLLGAVEDGTITLIGATTENPSFEVIAALLSRCQVYVLQPLQKEELIFLINQALEKDEYLQKKEIDIQEYEAILQFSGGDARKLYNILELIANSEQAGRVVVTNEQVIHLIQQNIALYDKAGEQHYDIASAFIKSIRGSDPNAAVYWLARMIEGGEDVKFIARRMMIAASEDIGLANPNALLMATTAFQAVQAVGLPEARIILSQAVIYLATSPKSNSAYLAIGEAQALVGKTGNLSVPLHLRNAPTSMMKDLQYGKGYLYAHDYPDNFIQQEFLPETITGTAIYQPQDNAAEKKSKEWLRFCWKEKYGY
ncbi:MAG TPA: replication-associated recombination protein A [Saprospiraceae bacterium]|nr:replication-associated recombination protein A [Saprospiraceae bacterium]HMQ81469.1 replication-associated recombination protein A [Saprospiraceae bacterium]